MKKGYLVQVSIKVVYSDGSEESFGSYKPLFVKSTRVTADEFVHRNILQDEKDYDVWKSSDSLTRGIFLLHRYIVTPIDIHL